MQSNLNKTIKILKNHFLNNASNKKKDYEAIEIIDKAYSYYNIEVINIINGSNKDASFNDNIKHLATLVIDIL